MRSSLGGLALDGGTLANAFQLSSPMAEAAARSERSELTELRRNEIVDDSITDGKGRSGRAMNSRMSTISTLIETPVQGARVSERGVSYCIWAPEHAELALLIRHQDGHERSHRMEAQPNGFFLLEDPNGRAGNRYAYNLPDGSIVPDPVSHCQPDGVHGWSECIDHRAYSWRCDRWQRPGWHGQSIYEIHVGTFTPRGTFSSVVDRLDHIAALGMGAIELMPVADFPGERNWGYDGVALFAPARCYGTPDELRGLVDAAHERGLAVILDVVYNHLGPDGNYLGRFSSAYFQREHGTPWGEGFNLDGPGSKPVRDLLLSNAAYWLDEYRFDGLRLDATHAIRDDSPRHLLAELAQLAHQRGAFLIAEDERNTCELLTRENGGGAQIDAVWADDFHHQVRVALTGIQEGYFGSYDGSAAELASVIQNGWCYTGQAYPFWKGRARGEPCRHLPTSAFITCIENHDQVGNRALGERLAHLVGSAAYRAASALLCFTPYPPMIFMGQEWGASTPFLYFTDHAGELGRQISAGRLKEFTNAGINQQLKPDEAPDPQRPETFLRSKLSWDEVRAEPHASILALYRRCLEYRARWLKGKTVERDAWDVASFERVIAIRYRRAEPAECLVISSLHGDARLSLVREPSLRPPDGYDWWIEFESRVSPAASGPAVNGPVETLVFRVPATLLLVAKRKTAGVRR